MSTNLCIYYQRDSSLMVYQQMKWLILSIIGIFRRALCCFSRKRKPSYSEPMTNVVVQTNHAVSSRKPLSSSAPDRDWNSWDDSPRTVQEHIEQYRQHINKPPTPQKEENEPDFFKELTPVIKPQEKYYLVDDTQSEVNFSRLEVKTDVPIALNADLEDWEEEKSGDWEEMDTEQARKLIRDKRREMRNTRQKAPQFPSQQSAAGLSTLQLNS